jgi:hypothetical protein
LQRSLLTSTPDLTPTAKNVTVMHKNQAFPLVGPLVVEDCLNEDCSLTTG